MKDLIITAKRIKIELLTFLICFVIANLLDLYAIIAYNTAYSELYTQIWPVLLFAAALYIFWSMLRVIFYFISIIFNTKN